MLELGTFQNESGKLVISDPCYDLGISKSDSVNLIVDSKPGLWRCRVAEREYQSWGLRCSELIAEHSDFQINSFSSDEPFLACVDSGQLGIYDSLHFEDDDLSKPEWFRRFPKDSVICTEQPWYSMNCALTLTKPYAGVLPFGCVSTSGFGDGSYPVYLAFDPEKSGLVVGIKVVFLNGTESEYE